MGVEIGYGELKEPTVSNDQEELKLFQVVSESGQARSNVGNDCKVTNSRSLEAHSLRLN